MNILFLSKCHSRSRCFSLGKGGIVAWAVLLMVVVPVGAMYGGYRFGASGGGKEGLSLTWQKEMEQQRLEIEDAKRVAQENLNALAMRLGQMQAHVMRLDALGQRLTRMADLENGEFDFENPPAQGGPSGNTAAQSLEVADFVALLDDLSRQLDDRTQQLDVLETMLINRNLQAEVLPAGRPVKSGWISSQYGLRTDPFSGKPEHHNGVDLAGKEGTDVIAVASGVVTWAGERYGYGQLVEINHGNGYVTRYGHNKSIAVKVGETVKKGQLLAHMGSTGRSTGPHVHFEVMRDGRAVDPIKYIQAAR